MDKQKGEHNQLYAQQHFLNTAIVADLPGLYSNYLVDLRDIRTQTRSQLDMAQAITGFERLLQQQPDSAQELEAAITPTGKAQYLKGL